MKIWATSKLILWFMAIWIAIFVAVLLVISIMGGGERVSAEAILMLSVIVCSALATVGLSEIVVSFEYVHAWRREFVAHSLLGCGSIAAAYLLAILSEVSIGWIATVLAPYALLFGVAQIRVGLMIPGLRQQSRAFLLCGAIEIVFGILLLASLILGPAWAVSVLGATACGTLLQFVPFLLAESTDPNVTIPAKGSR